MGVGNDRSSTGASRAIYDAWLKDEIIVITSGPLVDEVFDTLFEELKRPVDEVEAFIGLLLSRTDVVARRLRALASADEVVARFC